MAREAATLMTLVAIRVWCRDCLTAIISCRGLPLGCTQLGLQENLETTTPAEVLLSSTAADACIQLTPGTVQHSLLIGSPSKGQQAPVPLPRPLLWELHHDKMVMLTVIICCSCQCPAGLAC